MTHYQEIIPSTWNLSPADWRGRPGPLEEMLLEAFGLTASTRPPPPSSLWMARCGAVGAQRGPVHRVRVPCDGARTGRTFRMVASPWARRDGAYGALPRGASVRVRGDALGEPRRDGLPHPDWLLRALSAVRRRDVAGARAASVSFGIVLLANCLVRIVLAFVIKSAPSVLGTGREVVPDYKTWLPNSATTEQQLVGGGAGAIALVSCAASTPSRPERGRSAEDAVYLLYLRVIDLLHRLYGGCACGSPTCLRGRCCLLWRAWISSACCHERAHPALPHDVGCFGEKLFMCQIIHAVACLLNL